MYILGVESTAHTFGCGIVTEKGKVIANCKDSFSTPDGGMIPDQVAAHHVKVSSDLLAKAFEISKLTWNDIKFIAYSAGPGLDPALWAGYHIVSKWAEQHQIPLVGVNHCCAHLSIGKVYNKLKDPIYLYVSGVNTQVIIQEAGKYHVLGETLDIGLGNCLDKLGRILGLGFPAGPSIEKLAKQGKYVELPYVVKGMDVSFSGLLTRATQIWEQKATYKQLMQKQGKNIDIPYTSNTEHHKIIKGYSQSLEKPITKEDLCFSIQETAFAMCTEVVERAMANTGKKELLLVGGVGANQRFCEILTIMCKERGAVFYKVPMDLAGDQGAMIAWEGVIRHPTIGRKITGVQKGSKTYGDVSVLPHWRADEV